MVTKLEAVDPYNFETTDYIVRKCVGQFQWSGKSCYETVNKFTGVVEFEGIQLPAVILNTQVIQKALDDIRSGVTLAELAGPPFTTEPPSGNTLVN